MFLSPLALPRQRSSTFHRKRERKRKEERKKRTHENSGILPRALLISPQPPHLFRLYLRAAKFRSANYGNDSPFWGFLARRWYALLGVTRNYSRRELPPTKETESYVRSDGRAKWRARETMARPFLRIDRSLLRSCARLGRVHARTHSSDNNDYALECASALSAIEFPSALLPS